MKRYALGWFLLASVAWALMPPSVSQTSPERGPLFQGRILKFHGYSLHAAEDPAVLDVATQSPITFQQYLWCRPECRGRPGPCADKGPVPPGAEQSFCVMSVDLRQALKAGVERLRVQFLGVSVEVVRGGQGYAVVPAPASNADE